MLREKSQVILVLCVLTSHVQQHYSLARDKRRDHTSIAAQPSMKPLIHRHNPESVLLGDRTDLFVTNLRLLYHPGIYALPLSPTELASTYSFIVHCPYQTSLSPFIYTNLVP